MKSLHPPHGFTIVEMLVAIATVAILAILAVQAGGRIHERTQQAGCLSNLRLLHLFLNAYATENNDSFPPGYISAAANGGKSTTWVLELRRYSGEIYSNPAKKEGLPYCPATRLNGQVPFQRDSRTWKTDYNANGLVLSATSSKNKRTTTNPRAILLFDGGGRTSNNAGQALPHLRHWEHFNVIFVDGHAELGSSFDGYADRWAR
ncbi:MAG TPA: type II secretion system protein [Chthoniobacteraceae bacterium]|nr:type II secretion system protein [Chthoniobacteraceae bacterium]